jgi:hypothetical protein
MTNDEKARFLTLNGWFRTESRSAWCWAEQDYPGARFTLEAAYDTASGLVRGKGFLDAVGVDSGRSSVGKVSKVVKEKIVHPRGRKQPYG